MKKLFLILAISTGVVIYLNQSQPLWYVALLNYLGIGGTTISINFDGLKSDVTEELIKDTFTNLKFTCNPERSLLGDRSCWANITRFNGLKASLIVFFLRYDRLTNIRVTFPRGVHDDLVVYLNDEYQFEGVSEGSVRQFEQALGVWRSSTGRISAYTGPPSDSSKNLLLWTRL
jgi:hypothetical protein